MYKGLMKKYIFYIFLAIVVYQVTIFTYGHGWLNSSVPGGDFPGGVAVVTELKEIITKKVITTTEHEPIDIAIRKMKINDISALPIIDQDNKVIGIITSEELMH